MTLKKILNSITNLSILGLCSYDVYKITTKPKLSDKCDKFLKYDYKKILSADIIESHNFQTMIDKCNNEGIDYYKTLIEPESGFNNDFWWPLL